MPRTLVFVYGTLRREERNHSLLHGATIVTQQCWTYGELHDTGFGYPAMKPSQNKKVYGELYEVNDQQLSRLDQLEGYYENGQDNLYNRVKQKVYTDTESYESFVYIAGSMLKDCYNLIESGDWKFQNIGG